MNGTGCKNLVANIAESFAILRIIAKFKICETLSNFAVENLPSSWVGKSKNKCNKSMMYHINIVYYFIYYFNLPATCQVNLTAKVLSVSHILNLL